MEGLTLHHTEVVRTAPSLAIGMPGHPFDGHTVTLLSAQKGTALVKVEPTVYALLPLQNITIVHAQSIG